MDIGSPPRFGEFCKTLGAKVSLTFIFHPQSNGWMKRATQDLEAALHWVIATNSTTLATHLSWTEYASNSLNNSATAFFPLESSLFPVNEEEIAVTLVQEDSRHSYKLWGDICALPLRTNDANKHIADLHHTKRT